MADNNSKEWVTIKVPKDIRDEAREVDRTYGEVMADGLDGSHTNTQSHTQDHTTTNIEGVVKEIKDELSMAADPGVDEEQIVDDVVNRIDELEETVKEATHAAQSAERKVQELR